MLSLFDRLWHKDINEEEAVRLMELGIEEVSTHFHCIGVPCSGQHLLEPTLAPQGTHWIDWRCLDD